MHRRLPRRMENYGEPFGRPQPAPNMVERAIMNILQNDQQLDPAHVVQTAFEVHDQYENEMYNREQEDRKEQKKKDRERAEKDRERYRVAVICQDDKILLIDDVFRQNLKFPFQLLGRHQDDDHDRIRYAQAHTFVEKLGFEVDEVEQTEKARLDELDKGRRKNPALFDVYLARHVKGKYERDTRMHSSQSKAKWVDRKKWLNLLKMDANSDRPLYSFSFYAAKDTVNRLWNVTPEEVTGIKTVQRIDVSAEASKHTSWIGAALWHENKLLLVRDDAQSEWHIPIKHYPPTDNPSDLTRECIDLGKNEGVFSTGRRYPHPHNFTVSGDWNKFRDSRAYSIYTMQGVELAKGFVETPTRKFFSNDEIWEMLADSAISQHGWAEGQSIDHMMSCIDALYRQGPADHPEDAVEPDEYYERFAHVAIWDHDNKILLRRNEQVPKDENGEQPWGLPWVQLADGVRPSGTAFLGRTVLDVDDRSGTDLRKIDKFLSRSLHGEYEAFQKKVPAAGSNRHTTFGGHPTKREVDMLFTPRYTTDIDIHEDAEGEFRWFTVREINEQKNRNTKRHDPKYKGKKIEDTFDSVIYRFWEEIVKIRPRRKKAVSV